MAKTVERRILLTQEEDHRLRERARERGVSADRLVRDAVSQALDAGGAGSHDQERVRAREEWAQLMALMHARASLYRSPDEREGGRGWTREEIYDERSRRFAG